jgi:hypothetical protein
MDQAALIANASERRTRPRLVCRAGARHVPSVLRIGGECGKEVAASVARLAIAGSSGARISGAAGAFLALPRACGASARRANVVEIVAALRRTVAARLAVGKRGWTIRFRRNAKPRRTLESAFPTNTELLRIGTRGADGLVANDTGAGAVVDECRRARIWSRATRAAVAVPVPIAAVTRAPARRVSPRERKCENEKRLSSDHQCQF